MCCLPFYFIPLPVPYVEQGKKKVQGNTGLWCGQGATVVRPKSCGSSTQSWKGERHLVPRTPFFLERIAENTADWCPTLRSFTYRSFAKGTFTNHFVKNRTFWTNDPHRTISASCQFGGRRVRRLSGEKFELFQGERFARISGMVCTPL